MLVKKDAHAEQKNVLADLSPSAYFRFVPIPVSIRLAPLRFDSICVLLRL